MKRTVRDLVQVGEQVANAYAGRRCVWTVAGAWTDHRCATWLRMRDRAAAAWAFAGILACAGCVHRQTTTVEVTASEMEAASDLRSATNLPTRFAIITPAAAPGDCPPELRDTGLHTTLRLYRSLYRPQADTATAYRAVGDYTVEPRGRYGEGEDEGVRVDCTRLRAIGVVRLGVGQLPPGSSAMARARVP
jgi:hypothetical protein